MGTGIPDSSPLRSLEPVLLQASRNFAVLGTIFAGLDTHESSTNPIAHIEAIIIFLNFFVILPGDSDVICLVMAL